MNKRVIVEPLTPPRKQTTKVTSEQIISSIKNFASSKEEIANVLPSSASLFSVRTSHNSLRTTFPTPKASTDPPRTPKSARGSRMTASAARHSVQPAERFSVLVLSESRAREVGMATMNTNTHEIYITQFADNQHYSYTSELINTFAPTAIVLPFTSKDSSMYKTIVSNFPDLPLVFTERKYYNETQGLKIYNEAIKHRAIIDIEHKFTCLASLAALLRYAESSEELILSLQAIKIEYYFLEHIMHIDYRSCLKLELVMNLQQYTSVDSLFSLFETRTIGGRRLLRMNILHPLSDPVLIQKRVQLVEELLENETMLLSLVHLLPKFREFELYTGKFSQGLRSGSLPYVKQLTETILKLRFDLDMVADLLEVLQTAKAELAKAMFECIDVGMIKDIIDKIDEVFERQAKGNIPPFFWIKKGKNPVLDATKKAYNDYINKLFLIVEKYKEQTEDPTLKVEHSEKRGYFFSFMKPSTISRVEKAIGVNLIHAVTKDKRVYASTEELQSINERVKSMQNNISQMSIDLVLQTVNFIQSHIGCLYYLSSAISYLDMTLAFVGYILITPVTCFIGKPAFVRPGAGMRKGEGVIHFKAAQHPVLEKIEPSFVPNDVYMSSVSNFTLVTGANGSGKTTHLKQLALCIILAQMGCYVPCTSALLSPITHIFTRFNGYNDSLEENASSFCLEMQEIEYIIENLGQRALVLIDELADNSSVAASRPIAWSICEYLATTPNIYVMLSTHNSLLSHLAKHYPFVQVVHFQSTAKENKMEYKYKVTKGEETTKDYGIVLAEAVGLPKTIIRIAKEIAVNLDNVFVRVRFENGTEDTVLNEAYKVVSELEKAVLLNH